MASPEARSWLQYFMAFSLAEFGLEESQAIFQLASLSVAERGEEGATVADWIDIVTSIINQRHPSSAMAVEHAKDLFERRNYERPS